MRLRIDVSLAFLAVLCFACDAGEPLLATQTSRVPCATLTSLQLPDVRIADATAFPANTGASGSARAHCRVYGVIESEIGFAVWLPDDWNGRFFMGGGGGFVGAIQNSALSSLDLGYATAGTDTGHQGSGESAAWALDSAERQVNFAHRAVHRTAEVTKAIIRAYYGSASTRNYFSGCSRGGGQGVMEAIRYPEDFDGILAGAPPLDWAGIAAQFIKDSQTAFPDPNSTTSVLSPQTLTLVESRVLAACDGLDGVKDGVMTDPRRCTFDLESLPGCSGNQTGAACVTTRQRTALKAIYGAVRNQDGVIHPGQPFGSEGLGWPAWITGNPQFMDRGLRIVFGTEFFKYFVFSDPAWDYTKYDFATWKKDTGAVAALLNTTDPDLDRFKARNGKLIVWHGWSDPAVSALNSIQYYESVQTRDPQVQSHFRMFVMPGVLHCGNGPGPDVVDWTSAIVDWVENNRAPERVVARKITNGVATRSRPLCPYPQRAEYTGTGSTDDEAHFVCR